MAIATLRCPELRLPVADVATGDGSVVRAGVPEAAIDEDGDPGAGKDDIGDDWPTAVDS